VKKLENLFTSAFIDETFFNWVILTAEEYFYFFMVSLRGQKIGRCKCTTKPIFKEIFFPNGEILGQAEIFNEIYQKENQKKAGLWASLLAIPRFY